MSTRVIARKWFADILFRVGIIRYYKLFNGGCILGYHRVLPDDDESLKYIEPGMYVSTKTFEKHMRFISENFNPISLGEILKIKNFKNSVAVTLDDGWRDNYIYAFPILKKFGIPATIFFTSNLVGKSEWFWTDRIAYYLNVVGRCEPEFKATFFKILGIDYNRFSTKSMMHCALKVHRKDVDTVIKRLKNKSVSELREIMEQIDELMKPFSEKINSKRIWLSWNEIEEMYRQGVSFGCHTHNHIILTKTTMDEVKKELEACKSALYEHLDQDVLMFSYPNGDHNQKVREIVKDHGFHIAVTTNPGSIGGSPCPLQLNRVLIHNDMAYTTSLFVYRIVSQAR